MMRMIVNGARGNMGRQMLEVLDNAKDAALAAAVDSLGGEGLFAALEEYDGPADCIADFSFHTAAPALMDYALRRRLPVVVATTGHTPEEMARIRAASAQIPVFHAANMSLGVALLVDLAKRAAAAFPEADIEIVETHHNRKQDAPSGTALTLAKAIASVRPGATVQAGRAGQGLRKPGEITVHALRMGGIVGQHEVFVTTPNQQISIRHEAYSRALFAEGALSAARFLIGKKAGYYGMEDMTK